MTRRLILAILALAAIWRPETASAEVPPDPAGRWILHVDGRAAAILELERRPGDRWTGRLIEREARRPITRVALSDDGQALILTISGRAGQPATRYRFDAVEPDRATLGAVGPPAGPPQLLVRAWGGAVVAPR